MKISYHGASYHWSCKKFMINLMIILFMLSFWMVYISNVAKATSAKKLIEITVHHGDTLWSIAREISPHSDPRAVIKQIQSRNHLPKAELIAGQRLQVEMLSNI